MQTLLGQENVLGEVLPSGPRARSSKVFGGRFTRRRVSRPAPHTSPNAATPRASASKAKAFGSSKKGGISFRISEFNGEVTPSAKKAAGTR